MIFHYTRNYSQPKIVSIKSSLRHTSHFFLCSILLFIVNGCTPVYLLSHHPKLSKKVFELKVNQALRKAEKYPLNSIILLEAQKLLTQYGYAFQLEIGDRKIYKDYLASKQDYLDASKSFSSALVLGKNSLRIKYPEIDQWLLNPERIKIRFDIQHISNLYWTAASIGGLIKAGKGSPETIVLLPQIRLLLHTALEIDPSWGNGRIYTALISYTMSEFPTSKEKIESVKYYFDEAVRLSNGTDAGPFVAYAESVSIKNQDKEEFIRLLNKAVTISSTDDEEINLQNHIAGNHAKWLLSRTDELFY